MHFLSYFIRISSVFSRSISFLEFYVHGFPFCFFEFVSCFWLSIRFSFVVSTHFFHDRFCFQNVKFVSVFPFFFLCSILFVLKGKNVPFIHLQMFLWFVAYLIQNIKNSELIGAEFHFHPTYIIFFSKTKEFENPLVAFILVYRSVRFIKIFSPILPYCDYRVKCTFNLLTALPQIIWDLKN